MAGLKTMHGILALIDIVNFTGQADLETFICGLLTPPPPPGSHRQRKRHLDSIRF
jgi:hypothetical protein